MNEGINCTALWMKALYKCTALWIKALYKCTALWIKALYKCTALWIKALYKCTALWIKALYKCSPMKEQTVGGKSTKKPHLIIQFPCTEGKLNISIVPGDLLCVNLRKRNANMGLMFHRHSFQVVPLCRLR